MMGFAGEASFTSLCDPPPMHLASIPRASRRRAMNLFIKTRVRSCELYVDLLDLSEGGCRIAGKLGFAAVGDRVTMRIEGINAPFGTIAWIDGSQAGVAFDGTLHPAVLDHLCAETGAEIGKGPKPPPSR